MKNAMPKMPKMNAIEHDCACGCGLGTKREWHSGHDGRATGWAIRIEKGIIELKDVPANERRGAVIMVGRRAGHSEATIKAAIDAIAKAGRRQSKVVETQEQVTEVTESQVEGRTGTGG